MIPFCDNLEKKLLAARDELAREIALDPSRDFGDYRERAGIVMGIGRALEIAKDLEKEMMTR